MLKLNYKVINLLLVLFSLMPFLEWGGNNRLHLIEAEFLIFKEVFKNPLAFLHPLIILPLIGQLTLIFLFAFRNYNKYLQLAGYWMVGILVLFIFIIGLLTLNLKQIVFSFPYVFMGIILHIKLFRK